MCCCCSHIHLSQKIQFVATGQTATRVIVKRGGTQCSPRGTAVFLPVCAPIRLKFNFDALAKQPHAEPAHLCSYSDTVLRAGGTVAQEGAQQGSPCFTTMWGDMPPQFYKIRILTASLLYLICAKGFHGLYSEQPALPDRH